MEGKSDKLISQESVRCPASDVCWSHNKPHGQLAADRLIGLVVTASVSRAEDPARIRIPLATRIFRDRVIPVT